MHMELGCNHHQGVRGSDRSGLYPCPALGTADKMWEKLLSLSNCSLAAKAAPGTQLEY